MSIWPSMPYLRQSPVSGGSDELVMTARGDVLVAMSGGVDSSVAAALLLEQGFTVTGVTMKLWGGESDTGCCSVSDVDDARRVADQLGIDHHVFNFGDDFDDPWAGDSADLAQSVARLGPRDRGVDAARPGLLVRRVRRRVGAAHR